MMPFNIPSDFDAEWYLATYPDVALSGLSPKQHYRRFGKLMGRSANGAGASEEQSPAADLDLLEASPAVPEPQDVALPVHSFAIVERPSDFNPGDVVPREARLRPGREAGEVLSLEGLAEGPFANSGDEMAPAPLLAYAQMFGLQLAHSAPARTGSVFDPAFLEGESRIESAWYADDSRLRLQLAGGSGEASASRRWMLRAYQASPADPAILTVLGAGIELPLLGPAFHDVELLHPLMPLILEYSDENGSTGALALLAFPSLLPGGLHWAELKALQTEVNPMDEFWRRSGSLLRQMTSGAPAWLASISVRSGSDVAAPMHSAQLQDWIGAVFGLTLNSVAPSGNELSSALSFARGGPEGATLVLPEDCLPTISALVARNPGLDDPGTKAQHYLVADAAALRPLWSVTLPAAEEAIPDVPFTLPSSTSLESPSVHLAIAVRKQQSLNVAGPAIADAANPEGGLPALSVVLDTSDASLTAGICRALRDAREAGALQFLVRLSDRDDAIREELDNIFGPDGWSPVHRNVDLREIAHQAKHDNLLVLSDRIRLQDTSTLGYLCSLLNQDETAASASCALLAEKTIKRQVILQPAVGGLFPSRVSFSISPRLSFREPDVIEALPGLTYPVVANTFLLTVFRRQALADLPRMSVGSADHQDIRLGLDLMEAGYRSWCTTKIVASLSGPYVRRDSIDPMGGRYAELGRWEQILNRVALVRELS